MQVNCCDHLLHSTPVVSAQHLPCHWPLDTLLVSLTPRVKAFEPLNHPDMKGSVVGRLGHGGVQTWVWNIMFPLLKAAHVLCSLKAHLADMLSFFFFSFYNVTWASLLREHEREGHLWCHGIWAYLVSAPLASMVFVPALGICSPSVSQNLNLVFPTLKRPLAAKKERAPL